MNCFLCGGSENVIQFTNETLHKFRKVITFRKRKKFKYCDIEPPTSLDAVGYHIECYRKIMVLKQKYKEEFERMLQRESVSIDILFITNIYCCNIFFI